MNKCEEQLGLRERKRRETRLRIEDEATRLFLEKPFDCVTLDEICAAADISRRTFFNYFTSKDHVAVGKLPTPLTEDERGAIKDMGPSEHDTLAERVLNLVAARRLRDAAFEDSRSINPILASEIAERRVELLHRNPELAMAKMATFEKARTELSAVIEDNLRTYPDNRLATDICPVEEEAFLTVTAITIVLWSGSNLSVLRGEPGYNHDAAQTGFQLLRQIFSAMPEQLDLPHTAQKEHAE